MTKKLLIGSIAFLFLAIFIIIALRCNAIGVNVLSDFCTFAILISFAIVCTQFTKSQKAAFFGFDKSPKIGIWISENREDQQAGKQASSYEYDAAVELVKMLMQTGEKFPQNLLNRLLGLIGQEPFFSIDWGIHITPHEESFQLPAGNIVAIGGPESNEITRYFQEKKLLRFQFSKELDCYQVRANDEYRIVEPPSAFIEKLILSEGNSKRTIVIVHGHRALDTEYAANYLKDHWEELHKCYGLQEFAFRIPPHLLPATQ